MGIAAIAVGAMIGGTILKAKSAHDAAKSEAAFNKANAQVSLEESAFQRRASLEEQHIRREQAQKQLSSMRVAFAKGGVLPNLAVMLKAAGDMSKDIAMLAMGRERQAQRSASQASLDLMRAKSAKQAGRLGVGEALIGGVGNIAGFGANMELTTGEPFLKTLVGK